MAAEGAERFRAATGSQPGRGHRLPLQLGLPDTYPGHWGRVGECQVHNQAHLPIPNPHRVTVEVEGTEYQLRDEELRVSVCPVCIYEDLGDADLDEDTSGEPRREIFERAAAEYWHTEIRLAFETVEEGDDGGT